MNKINMTCNSSWVSDPESHPQENQSCDLDHAPCVTQLHSFIPRGIVRSQRRLYDLRST